MFKVGDYVIYRKDVCKLAEIRKNKMNNKDYYLLIPINDNTLKIDVPTDNRMGYLRSLISLDEVNSLINRIPDIEIVDTDDKLLENTYKRLLDTGSHEDLIKIIKTTYVRNKKRLDNNKKISEKDNNYFNSAEKYLYNEFSCVLGLSYLETKEYVVKKVEELVNV